jgi:hypothetical protein
MEKNKIEIRTVLSKENYDRLSELARKYEMPITTFIRLQLIKIIENEQTAYNI